MEKITLNNLEIRIDDDSTYTAGSADNVKRYDKEYFNGDPQYVAISQHGIMIFENDELISSCIIIGNGGATGIHPSCYAIDVQRLLICCTDSVFCLDIPNLDLQWKTKCDFATCFQIFKLEDDFIVHGELNIVRLNKNGEILWTFSGHDVFVTDEGKEEFKMTNDHIALTDFEGNKYKLDFHGKVLS